MKFATSLCFLLFSLSPLFGEIQLDTHDAASDYDEDAPKSAFLMEFGDQWYMDEDIPEYAMLISLQGLANQSGPLLYFIYPDSWPWKITRPLKDFYEERHNFTFEKLSTPREALEALGSHAKGYVVWDKEVRTSLIVAFTVAGLEDAIVINEDQIPMAQSAGLAQVADLRGDFRGMTDAEIYRIAMDRYWDRTSRDIVIWMGGYHNRRMEPGIADYGIYRTAFFTDLSASPEDPEELALHHEILQDMNPRSFVMGWHSYGKDTEGQHVTLTSTYGLRMEGLNSLPNISFNTQIPWTRDFQFKNNHNVEPDEELVPEKKVYLAFIQTDSMGIGAWTKPGRGRIPYAWQILGGHALKFQPASAQYYAESATPNDYFIAGLTGPSYMYPKPIPEEDFWPLMELNKLQMDVLDLRVMEIMDYSEGNRHVGNTDLPKEIVDRYYEAYPDVIGFINGYGAARTFDLRDGVPLISYDYYLGVKRPEDEAVADMEELISLNRERPYFLLIHVRESTNIDRVANIVERLGDDVEVVPLDVFLKLAAGNKTYRTRYQQPDDPIDLNAF